MENNIKQPSVLLIILNYKTYNLTFDIINQIHSINYDNYDILVIDNCSPNDSAKILADKADEMGYIFIGNQTNSGYAAGNNIGFRYAHKHHYKYSLVMNNDLQIKDNDFLLKLVGKAEENENIVCVGPQIYSPDGSIIAPYIDQPTFGDMTFSMISYHKKRKSFIGKRCQVYRIYGCCMLLKTELLRNVDYFDERTFLYQEENILAEKFMHHGYETWYLGDVPLIHLGGGSTEKKTRKQINDNFKILKKSMNIYLKDYREFNFIKRQFCIFFAYLRTWL